MCVCVGGMVCLCRGAWSACVAGCGLCHGAWSTWSVCVVGRGLYRGRGLSVLQGVVCVTGRGLCHGAWFVCIRGMVCVVGRSLSVSRGVNCRSVRLVLSSGTISFSSEPLAPLPPLPGRTRTSPGGLRMRPLLPGPGRRHPVGSFLRPIVTSSQTNPACLYFWEFAWTPDNQLSAARQGLAVLGQAGAQVGASAGVPGTPGAFLQQVSRFPAG